jgi:CO/xanthine dehydrogenase FAD-binding subunit
MQMGSDELLTRIRLPRRSTSCYHYYRKVGTRKAQAISKVCLAAVGWKRNGQISDVRIALGSVAPIVIRCVRTEDTLRDKAISRETIELARESLINEITPIDDIRSTASYRLRVATNLLADFLEKLQID